MGGRSGRPNPKNGQSCQMNYENIFNLLTECEAKGKTFQSWFFNGTKPDEHYRGNWRRNHGYVNFWINNDYAFF